MEDNNQSISASEPKSQSDVGESQSISASEPKSQCDSASEQENQGDVGANCVRQQENVPETVSDKDDKPWKRGSVDAAGVSGQVSGVCAVGTESHNDSGIDGKDAYLGKYKNLFDGLGLVNPYTGQAIVTIDDMVAYKETYLSDPGESESQSDSDAASSDGENRSNSASEPESQSDSAPEAGRLTHEAREIENQRIKNKVDDELAKIRKWGINFNTLKDVAESPYEKEIYEMVQKGYALSDAVVLAHAEELRKQTAEKAAQKVRNDINGKAHLVKTDVMANKEPELPAEIIAEYKRFLPDASVEEIREFHFSNGAGR